MAETDRAAVRVVAAADQHVPAIAAIATSSFRDAYGQWSDPHSLETHLEAYFSEAAITERMQSGEATYLVAEVDDQVGGMLSYRVNDCPGDERAARALELWQIYIDPRRQRLGLGERLMQAVVSVAAETGANGVWLSVWQQADWAVRFYTKCGFVKVGIADFKIGDENFADDILWRPPD